MELPKHMQDLNFVVLMEFGSQLYGTDTENSDVDLKGVFLPTKEQVFLNRVPKSVSYKTKKGNEERNTSDDIDIEVYSLHYFLKLAVEGQTAAIDMLHAPNDKILRSSDIWESLVFNRNKFYTKNLKAFVSYARRQAAKYGIKGSRLNDAKRVQEFLQKELQGPIDPTFFSNVPVELQKLADVWDRLPEGEHIHNDVITPQGLRVYQVCGKQFQETAKLSYVLPIISNFVTQYGKRAKQAAMNEGIDFKAVSHALRAAFQVKQMLTEGTITFPLAEADYLRAVKQGKLNYLKEVAPRLEELMEEVEELSAKSTLPETVNHEFWDKWLYETIDDYYWWDEHNGL